MPHVHLKLTHLQSSSSLQLTITFSLCPFLFEVKSFTQSQSVFLPFGSNRSVTRSCLAVAAAPCPVLAPTPRTCSRSETVPHPQMPALFTDMSFLYLYCIKSTTASLYRVITFIKTTLSFQKHFLSRAFKSFPFTHNQPIFSDIYSLVSPN